MMKEVDDENYSYYEQFAGELAKDINEKTWDEETGFYYDLHHETDEKAMVKNIVGLYPYWAELSDDDKLRGMDYLLMKIILIQELYLLLLQKTVLHIHHSEHGWDS